MIATLQALILVTIPCLAIAFALLLSLVDTCDATLPTLADDAPSFSYNAPSFYPGTTPEFLAVLKANLVSEAPNKAVEMVATVAAKPMRDAKGRFIPRNVVNAVDSMQAQVLAECAACWQAPNNDRPCMVPANPFSVANLA